MLKGIPVSEGIGIGSVYAVKEEELSYDHGQIQDVEAEISRFRESVDQFCHHTERLAEAMEQTVDAKEVEIIRGHTHMLKDPFMISQIEAMIKEGISAEAASASTLDQFIDLFSQADDDLTRQRATDVRDIKRRLLKILLKIEEKMLRDIPPGSILVTEDLTPSMTAEMKKENVCGIITEKGGKTSHSAILARAMEIPAVVSVEHAVDLLKEGSTVIVDGGEGTVIPQPNLSQQEHYEKVKLAYEEEKELLRGYIGEKTVTADGRTKEVYCNIGNPADAVAAAEKDGEGIGLFRTEFLFMDKKSAPSEEEQFEAYKKVAQVFRGKEVIIRTLDVGGDKDVPYLNMDQEENPFLGFRAVRYCLANEALYETQLRAIIRASAFGKLRIMVPLVTNVEEIRSVREKVRNLTRDLIHSGINCDKNIPVGIMIETPAASLIADILAKESDFFSIGTNDLTQYTMAADRGNSQVAYLNRVYDPAVLRSIRRIIQCGKAEGIPVGMCGEAAADPLLTPMLLAFGMEEFSVSPASVLKTRHNISKWTQKDAEDVAEKAMELESADAVEAFLKRIECLNSKEDMNYDKDCN